MKCLINLRLVSIAPMNMNSPAVDDDSPRLLVYDGQRTSRANAASYIGTDTRKQPKAEEEIEEDPQIRPVMPVGGVVVFSAAQLYSSVPNTSGRTEFSIDFRVVDIGDVESGRGAPNLDSECTGTTLGDYLRIRDLAHLPDDLIARFDIPPRAAD